MLVTGTSASILGLRTGLIDGNVMGGLMTAYFIGTALTTVSAAALIRRFHGDAGRTAVNAVPTK